MKKGRAIQKTRACLQNEPIIASLSHSIKFFHKKKYCETTKILRQAENFKSVFVWNIIMVGLFYFNFFKILLFEWPTCSMTYFYVFFRTCWADLQYEDDYICTLHKLLSILATSTWSVG